jgi:hypothetical protein
LADIVEEVGHLLPLGRRRDSVNPADSAGETAMMGFQETPRGYFMISASTSTSHRITCSGASTVTWTWLICANR